ncbi:MAG TPA: glutaredoxin family protein [Chloroflexota bacterium]|nr:glutaredoxin family protein [Chloroflexota bacterium]
MYCRTAKRQLAELGVPFEEVDVEEHPEAGAIIEQHTGGFRTVPTFDIDGKIYVNPNRAELEQAVRG